MAGSKVGSAWYELRADEKGLQGDLTRATGTMTKSGAAGGTGFSTGFGKGLAGIKQSIGGILQSLGTLKGAAVGIGAAFVATKIVAFFGDAITAASDLNETTSKVGVVFGEAADKVFKMGETSAKSLGMSESAALAAAATYGNLFRAMGITEEASASMSVGLVDVAADLASFNNMDPTEVLDKLRAGLSGETEPLRSLGVNLNAAGIAAKAMEMGLASSTAGLTPAIKAQATYALIMEQTTLAQGDFDRTSGGLANQQRILAAELENVTAEIGQMLLPVMVELAHFAVDTLIPALRATVSYFKTSSENIGNFADGVSDFVTRFQIRIGDLGKTVEDRANQIGVDVAAMKELVIQNMTEFGQSFETAKLNAERSMLGLPPIMSDAVNATVAAWKERDLSGTIAADVAAGAPVIDAGVEAGITEPTKEELEATRLAAENAARAMTADYAATIASGADNVTQAWDALLSGAETEMTETARIADIQAKLAAPALRDALESEDPYLYAQAVATKETLLDELALLEAGAIEHAVNTGQSLPDALNSKKEAARIAAYQTRLAAVREFDLMALPATAAGTKAGVNLGVGIGSQYSSVNIKASNVGANAVRGMTSGGAGSWAAGSKMGVNLGVGVGSQYYNVHTKASNVGANAVRGMNSGGSGAYAGGVSIGRSWGLGILAGMYEKQHQIVDAANYYGNLLGGSLPTVGPLKGGVRPGGLSIGESWVGGLADSLGAGPRLVAAVAAKVNEQLGVITAATRQAALAAHQASLTRTYGGAPRIAPPAAKSGTSEDTLRRLTASLAALQGNTAPGAWTNRQMLTSQIDALRATMGPSITAATRQAALAAHQASLTRTYGGAPRIAPLNTVINVNGYNRDPVELSRTIATQIRLRASSAYK